MEQIGYIKAAADLDAIFSALADPTRRDMLGRLAKGDCSVGELAAPFEMSQPAISKHLKVLERAGLVTRTIDRQKRPASLNAKTLKAAVDWLKDFEAFWTGSFDQLDHMLAALKPKKGSQDHE